MHFRAILNKDGGTLRTTDLESLRRRAQAIFDDAGHSLDCRLVSGKNVDAELKASGESPEVDVILAGGGDGTISAAATEAFRSGKILAVLPAGTMNLFARALSMPTDLDAAFAAIANGTVAHIDIGTANGRLFVHQFGVGVHARLVRIRDEMSYGSRWGKMLASLRAIGAAAVNPPKFTVEISSGVRTKTSVVSGIAISNNPLDNSPVPVAARLDSGLFGVYVAESLTTRELLNLALDLFTGKWREHPRVSEAEVSELVLKFPKRKRNALAVVDGELIKLDQIVHFKMEKGGLAVIRPATLESVSGDQSLSD